MIELENVTKVYRTGNHEVRALDGVTLRIERGESVAVIGPSGSGKTTLMNIISCLDRPTSGRYVLAGQDVSRLDRDRLAGVRNRTVGLVFQSYNLLPRLTALQNVELPLLYRGVAPAARRAAAAEALERVGLAAPLYRHRPAEMSGGQQQRVAIARAIVGRPEVLLADEPTGALDSRTGQEVLDLLTALNETGITLVVVTHEAEVARRCRRLIRVRDGRVEAA